MFKGQHNFIQTSFVKQAPNISLLDQNLRDILYKNINIDNSSSETITSLLYLQTQNILHKQLPHSQGLQNNVLVIQNSNAVAQSQEAQQLNFGNELMLFEDTKCINQYTDKPEFLQMYETRIREIKKQQEILKIRFEAELPRIVKEFDFRNYAGVYRTNAEHVFCLLWGAEVAATELIRNQMLNKKFQNKTDKS